MSLINDALKRAKQHQPPPAPASIEDIGAPMRPVEPPRRPGSGASTLIVGLIAIVLVLAGAMFYLAGRSSAGPLSLESSAAPASQAISPTPTTTAPPITSAPNAAALLPVEQPVVTNLAISSPKPPEVFEAVPTTPTIVTQVLVVTTNVPVAAPPTLKLQGIFYRPSRPSAMLNGKTVLIGERVADARVLAITQTNVTVLQNGQTNVLSLE